MWFVYESEKFVDIANGLETIVFSIMNVNQSLSC